MRLAAEYSATCGHTSVAGDMWVSCQAHGSYREFKVAPRIVSYFLSVPYSSLTDRIILSGTFFVLLLWQKCQRSIFIMKITRFRGARPQSVIALGGSGSYLEVNEYENLTCAK